VFKPLNDFTNRFENIQIVSHRSEQFYKAMDILTKLKYFKKLLAPDQNHLANIFQLKDLIAKTYFNFYFNFMPVSCEKHTKKQCASAPKCAKCTNLRMFFCRAHPRQKFVEKNGLFSLGGHHAQVSQSYPRQERPLGWRLGLWTGIHFGPGPSPPVHQSTTPQGLDWTGLVDWVIPYSPLYLQVCTVKHVVCM